MNRALLLKTGDERIVHVIEVPEDQLDPYTVAKGVIGDWVERVKTPIKNVDMFVDDTGHLKRLPFNLTASSFYAGGIVGDAMLFYTRLEFDHEGPNTYIDDFPETLLTSLLNILAS